MNAKLVSSTIYPAPVIHPATMDFLDADVMYQHFLGTHRPTVVGIVENDKGKVLLVKSARSQHWGFPQGGAEKSEGAIPALLRELQEEVGIESSDIEIKAYCLGQRLDIPGPGRDGFKVGKKYHYFHLLYHGTSAIRMQRSEISDYHWFSRARAEEFIAKFDPSYHAKAQSMLAALSTLSP